MMVKTKSSSARQPQPKMRGNQIEKEEHGRAKATIEQKDSSIPIQINKVQFKFMTNTLYYLQKLEI